jgi:hypothetical protein
MKRQTLIPLLGLMLLCSLNACSRTTTNSEAGAQGAPDSSSVKRVTSAGVVKVQTPLIELHQGAEAEGSITLQVQDGYHVNANPPSYPYLKATELEITPSDGIALKSIAYPTALTRKFSFEKQPLAVYEGETPLKLILKADQSARKGERHLPGKLRIQACDNEVCYPPGTIDLTIPVEVK